MTSGRFTILFLLIFCLGALPLLLVQQLGGATAGIVSGVILPLSHASHIILFLPVGMLTARLGPKHYITLPAAFMLMMSLGLMLDWQSQDVPAAKLLILAAILCFGIIANGLSLAQFIASTAITSGFAFMLGSAYAQILPNTASPIFFLLGALLSTGAILAVGLCIGVTCSGLLTPFMPESWSLQTFLAQQLRFKKPSTTKAEQKPEEAAPKQASSTHEETALDLAPFAANEPFARHKETLTF